MLLPDIGKIAGARKGLLPTFLEPSLAAPSDKPPSGPNWIHEIKHDGYRIQARIDGIKVQLSPARRSTGRRAFAASPKRSPISGSARR